jgi:hydroxymethylbilane synthase
MKTIGDKNLEDPLRLIGSKSLFTKELEEALYNKQVDLVVHSLKDVPTRLSPEFSLTMLDNREDPRDAVIFKNSFPSCPLHKLSPGQVIGTSSVRRISQLSYQYPHLQFKQIRGNINTRLAKLDSPDSPYSAIILAKAGLDRLGLNNRIAYTLSPLDEKPIYWAVGQGALAVEYLTERTDVMDLLDPLTGKTDTLHKLMAERSLMRHLDGGCSVPLGCQSNVIQIEGGDVKKLSLTGVVCDKNKWIQESHEATITDLGSAEQLGIAVAKKLIAQGAQDIIICQNDFTDYR